MATVMSNLLNVDQQDDMDIVDNANSDIDFFDVEGDVDAAIGDAPLPNEDEMQDDIAANIEPEDIELRSATAESDYMVDDVAPNLHGSSDGVMADDMPVEEADEELLDFSDEEIGYIPQDEAQENDNAIDIGSVGSTEDDNQPASFPSQQQARETEADATEATLIEAPHDTSSSQHGKLEEPASVYDFQPSTGVLQPTMSEENNLQAIEVSTIAGQDPHLPEVNQVVDDSHVTHDTVKINNAQYEEVDQERNVTEHSYDDMEAQDPELTASKDAVSVEAGLNEEGQLEKPLDATDNEHAIAAISSQQAPSPQDAEATVDTPRSQSSEGQHTYTGLHTAVVKYEGGEYSLFPSSGLADGEEYFLENENLASGSIGDLLQACRVVLGDAILDDEELELHVEDLGLYLSEDSPAAFSTSFSELLDIFVQLHRQDGNDQPPPMSVSLTRKARFANRLTLLANAAAEGKGLSQLPFLQLMSHETHHEVEAGQQADNEDPREEDEQDFQNDTNSLMISEHVEQSGAETEIAQHSEQQSKGQEIGHNVDENATNGQYDDNATSRTLSPGYVEGEFEPDEAEHGDHDPAVLQHQGPGDDIGGEDSYASPQEKSSDDSIDHATRTGDHAEVVNEQNMTQTPSQLLQQASDDRDSAAAVDNTTITDDAGAAEASFGEQDPAEPSLQDDDDDFLDLTEEDAVSKDQIEQSNKRSIDEVVEAEDQEGKRPRST
ncbi:Hypothetical protein D9617_40g012920 [Elsinoe fawcettii]|nr:Hypothetical protein D9617_40g012920 [Elsinoe fawcettii]